GDRATFFKVVGPVAAVEERKAEIDAFFASLKAGEDGRPIWKAPSGWKEDAGTGMRMATLWVPSDGKPLEMSVTALPWRGTEDDLVSNVNRWRGQMQLQPIGPQQLKDVTSEIKAGDATITLVDLHGRSAGGGMMAPFAGAGAANRAAPGAGAELPAGHPPVDSVAGPPGNAAVTAAGVPKFEAPKSWQPVAASGIRKAEFAIGSKEQGAVVTLIDFSANAGPMMTDPLANVNRWRGEIGLAKIEKGQLEESTESIEIGGEPAKYVRLIPDASKPEESKIKEATLAAMVTNRDKIWFIKMRGARDTVVAEEENFKAFLKSMKFSDGSGVPNGDK
ncbi:MAG TPA: hypothetical protein VHK01_22045, partial [Lacipirellulaceae bacterium]|nr:hypothetical protein [Lacipirellulaceae bacterium]